MAYEGLEFVRIEGEFLSLAGGDVWDRVENVAWQRQLYERLTSTAKQREFRSREHGRKYHRTYERTRRVRNKQRVVVVRCCPVCRRMWPVTAAQLEDGSRICSRRCVARQRVAKGLGIRAPRMVTIDGVTRSLPEWASQYGITVGMVYARMRKKGMTDVEALTTPKAQGKR